MDKKTIMLIWSFCISLLVGCVETDLYPDDQSDRKVKLTGYIPSPIVATKASGIDYIYDYFEPTGDLSFSFLRWDQGESTNPANNTHKSSVLTAKLGDPVPTDEWRRYVEFDPIQYFDNDENKECGFAGCYPPVTNSNWVTSGTDFVSADRKMIYNIDGKTDVIFSDFKKGSFNTGIEPLTFRHALCLFKVYAYAVDQDSKDEWGKLDAVTFINLPEQLFVTLPEDMTSPDAEVQFSYSPKKANSSDYVKQHIILDETITEYRDGYPVGDHDGEGLSIPAGYSADNLQYIGAILGGAPEEVLGINVSMDDPEIIAESAVSIARDFQPGYTYNIILRFSTHGIVNASVIVEDWPDTPIVIPEDETNTSTQKFFTNLSRYGTANSYIVSSANMGYAIDCTKKGNGVNSITSWNGQTYNLQDTDPNINPDYIASIKVIWSDVVVMKDGSDWSAADGEEHDQALINLVSDKPVEGKILFEVNGNDDPEDYSLIYRGNALIGAYDATDNLMWSWHIWVTDKPLNLNYGNGYISQDRNLGAVSSESSFYAKNSVAVSGMCYQWGRKDPLNPDICIDPAHNHKYMVTVPHSQQSMLQSHRHPTTFYDSGGEWCSDGNDYQWGYISDQDEMYKTMYDPCPPGYRVNGNPLWEVQSNETLHAPVDAGNNSGWYFGIGDRLTIYYANTTYFDKDGVIQLASASNTVYQYSANPGYRFMYPPTSAGQPLNQVERSSAYPVRCVLETSKKAITDLSREQSANCYLVEKSGYYKFNARVAGNGVGSLSVQDQDSGFKTVAIHGDVSLSSVAKVDVLWWQGDLASGSSYMNFASGNPSSPDIENACPVKMLDYDYVNESRNIDEDGYAYFLVEKDKLQNANIILAGYDINGNIRWTWHLWMLPEGLDVVRFGQYTVMDRNVGATFSPKTANEVNADNVFTTYGFYYQWGRKDPFVPPADHAYNSSSKVSSPWLYKNHSTGEWRVRRDLELGTSAVTIGTAVENPTVFYPNKTGSYQTTYKQNVSSHIWGYTGLEDTESYSSAKTMWDPCPPGYKQIDHTTLGSVHLWNANSASSSSITSATATDYGLYITDNTSVDGKIDTDPSGFWLPFSRGIHEDGAYLVVSDSNGYEGQLNTLCPYNGLIWSGWLPENAKDRSRSLLYSKKTMTHDNEHYQSRGKTVRCQKE